MLCLHQAVKTVVDHLCVQPGLSLLFVETSYSGNPEVSGDSCSTCAPVKNRTEVSFS